VLSREAPDPGTRLSIRIPREVADGRALSLVGRVLRSERRLGASADTRHVFAARFEDVSSRTRERLAVILQERHLGPATLPGRVKQERADVRRPRRLTLKLAEPPRKRETGTLNPERRRSERAVMTREVVALDPDEARVKHVLFGRDLSVGGMRIEPHPELALGDRIRLAIYDASPPETVVLEATVRRDDRERGMLLGFDDVAAEVRERLERMISELSSVESRGLGEESKPLVVAEIVSE
jgi:hypothetical protein